MEYDKTRIGIAYVNGVKERRLNKKKYKKLEREIPCCSFQYVQYLLQMNYKKRQKYVHSEILFCYGKSSSTADSFGVFEGTGVTRQQREFGNRAYNFIFISVSMPEFDTIFNFCNEQLKKPFDYTAASWRLLIYPPKSTNRSWWCASFVHAALKRIGLMTNYRLNTLDNDDLITLIEKSREFSGRLHTGMNPGDFRNLEV